MRFELYFTHFIMVQSLIILPLAIFLAHIFNNSQMTQQIELFAIDNLCIGVCQSNKKGFCFGCLRSRPERQMWLQMTDEQRREVIRLIVGRKKRIEQMRQRQKEQLSMDFDGVNNWEESMDLFGVEEE